ncbi:MAG: hypothetical protein AAF598_18270 [Bacteroidota bacterium]
MREQFQLQTFVETGTFRGDTLAEQLAHFSTLYSVEIDARLHQAATSRFQSYAQVRLLLGDSGQVLPDLCTQLDRAALFWLDGHYSGPNTGMGEKECPILEELEALSCTEHEHVILIDDARCFDGTHDYPALERLLDLIRKQWPNYTVEVKHDIIRAYPQLD